MRRLHHSSPHWTRLEGRSQSWKNYFRKESWRTSLSNRHATRCPGARAKSAKFLLFETWKIRLTLSWHQKKKKKKNKVWRPKARCQTQYQDFKRETTSPQFYHSRECKAGPHIPLFTCKSHQKWVGPTPGAQISKEFCFQWGPLSL